MKSLKEISESVGVSKTAVRNKLFGKYQEYLQEHTETQNNTLYVDDVLTNLLMSAFKKSVTETVVESEQKVPDNMYYVNLLETLQSQLAVKDGQLAERSAEIARLTQMLENQQQITMRQALSLPSIENPLEGQIEPRKGLLNRILGR